MTTREICLHVFDGFADWEAALAIAGINNPQGQRTPGRFRLRSIAPTRAPVVSAGGLRVLPDLSLDELPDTDLAMLILPGGDGWDEGGHREAVAAAERVLNAGGAIAAICAATAGLARAGLLDLRRHTSNSADYLRATRYAGESLYVDEPAVTDGGLITAAGTAPVDFARHVFRHLDLYPHAVLDAWYALFKTGRPEHFEALVRATQSAQAAQA